MFQNGVVFCYAKVKCSLHSTFENQPRGWKASWLDATASSEII